MLKRLVEGASILCLVLALAVPVFAGNTINVPGVLIDSNSRSVYNTFFQCEGDSVSLNYGTDGYATEDTASVTIDPDGWPAWLIVTFPEETNALTAWFRFEQVVDGMATAYTWSGWVPKYIGGTERDFVFNVGLWDQCEVHVTGSAAGVMDCYWYVENVVD